MVQAGRIFVSLFVSLHHKPRMNIEKNGARYRVRTCDPYRVKASKTLILLAFLHFFIFNATFNATQPKEVDAVRLL